MIGTHIRTSRLMEVFTNFYTFWSSLTIIGFVQGAANVKLNAATNLSLPFGILNVYHNGQWGTVCRDGWNITLTNVACRQLGYSRGVAFMHMGSGTGKIWLGNVTCTGSESSLDQCGSTGWGVHDCDHTKDVGIVCQSVLLPITVRLSGGRQSSEGRVEVRYNNVWGTICDDGWNTNNANVICKMLGYNKALQSKSFGPGSGNIWLDDVSCTGSETSIDKCTHNGWGKHNCVHSQDISIVCLKGTPDVSVRLVSIVGVASNGGRVDVRYYGSWKSICDANWDLQDANVVCKMLGHSQGAAAVIRNFQSSNSVWLSDVRCSGHELSIANCNNLNWGQGNCAHNRRASVLCKSGSSTIQFFLAGGTAGGTAFHSGRLMMRYYGMQGPVCANNFDLQDANVVCRMMGYSQAITIYSRQEHRVYIFSLIARCNGHETSIQQCGYSLNDINSCGGYINGDTWIVCKPTVSWTTQVRLQGGSSSTGGRVEIQLYGVWGRICNSRWGIFEANVACRMLGYKGALRFYTAGGGSGPVWLKGVKCKGDENNVMNCTHIKLRQWIRCGHGNDVGIVCHSYPDVQVRLSGGVSPYSGRVEVKFNNIWGTICGNRWGLNEANVVCRMLNYQRAIAAVRYFGGGSAKIWLRNVQCTGTEESLEKCSHSGWQNQSCSHDADVGVICNASNEGPNVAVRLVKGSTPNKGRVEVRYHGIWGTVCNHYWGPANAHVVCRMLNYSKASWSGNAATRGSGPILLDAARCHGDEKSLEYCQYKDWGQHSCNHYMDVGVKCETNDSLIKVELSLEEGSSPNSGRVAVRYGNVWGTICNRGLDINDAKVICRMLGYPGALNTYNSKPGNGTIWLSNLACYGTENSLVYCRHPGWGKTACNHYQDAGVVCKKVNIPRFLVNGSSAVTESTVVLLIEASNPIDQVLNSSYQIVMEKVQYSVISSSMGQKRQHLPAIVEHYTIATNNGSSFYVTGEVQDSTSPSNFTVGDGLDYRGYYNAPLEPGCIYKVQLRIVTRSSTGRDVFGDSSSVAFTTKITIAKAATVSKAFQAPGSIVIVLSIALVVCIATSVGCFVCLKLRRQMPENKGKSENTEGIEMNRTNTHAPMYGTTEGHYQPLLQLSLPQQEGSYYANVPVSERTRNQPSTATSSGNPNTKKKDDVLYENISNVSSNVGAVYRI